MKRIRYVQVGGVLLLVLATLLVGLAVRPARATNASPREVDHATQQLAATTAVNAEVYITLGTLQLIFANRISQQIPVAFSSAISTMMSKLPKQDQGWAQQMAVTLIQPSASLTGLSTQANGIAASLRVTLYPGDPQPINSTLLVRMSVLNASTIQVTATPVNGSPALVSGPLTTFQIPLGQLNSINTTPGCGDAALGIGMLFPVALGQTSGQGQVAISSGMAMNDMHQTHFTALPRTLTGVSANTNSYVEIPASSLAAMGGSVGSLPVSNNLTAKNIRIGVQGSNLVITSDIYDSFFGNIGTALTTVAPTASNGNLAVHVLNTNLQLFGLFSFPYNSYNAQIENTLNSKLNGALAGKFTVASAAIGPNAAVPCTAGDSLVLTGTAAALG